MSPARKSRTGSPADEGLRVLVTGADDVWGQLTAEAVLAAGALKDALGRARPVEAVILVVHDRPWDAKIADDPRVRVVRGDIANRAEIVSVLEHERVGSIFHFETVTRDRGAGEDDFDAMLRTNLFGSLNLLQGSRALAAVPKVVFCSSCSVFEDGIAGAVSEETRRLPSGTYGTTKAMVELLMNDYSRRGFIDGRAAILPMCVSWRPDRRSAEFLHDVFDEPFGGEEIVLGLRPETRLFLNGYATCIANLLELHDLGAAELTRDRCVLQPGVTISVGEMVATFERIAAERGVRIGPVVERLDPEKQATVDRYVKDADTSRAHRLGLSSEGFDAIARRYLERYLELRASPVGGLAPEPA